MNFNVNLPNQCASLWLFTTFILNVSCHVSYAGPVTTVIGAYNAELRFLPPRGKKRTTTFHCILIILSVFVVVCLFFKWVFVQDFSKMGNSKLYPPQQGEGLWGGSPYYIQLCTQAAFIHVRKDGNRKQRKGVIPGFSRWKEFVLL